MQFRKRFESYRKDTDVNLEKMADALDEIVAAITNQSRKTITEKLSKVVVAKLAGIGTISGIGALISALGTASTGAAIGSLSGAAATSAKLYWLGSAIGLGATGGFFVLGGLGLLGGIAAVLGIKKLKGSARSLKDLHETEKKLVNTCLAVSQPIRLTLGKKEEIPADDVGKLFRLAIIPLVGKVEEYLVNLPQPSADTTRLTKNLELMQLWNRSRRLKICLGKLRSEIEKQNPYA